MVRGKRNVPKCKPNIDYYKKRTQHIHTENELQNKAMSTVAQHHHYVFVGSTSAFSQRDCAVLCLCSQCSVLFLLLFFLFVHSVLLYQLPYKRIKGFGCNREFMRDATRILLAAIHLLPLLFACITV